MSRLEPRALQERFAGVFVDWRSRTSWGLEMPTAELEISGWRHWLDPDAAWYTWSDTFGVWVSERTNRYRWYSRNTVAAGVYWMAGGVPAAFNGGQLFSPFSQNSALLWADAQVASATSGVVELRAGATNVAGAELDFNGDSRVELTPTSLVSLTGDRLVQALSTGADVPGGFVSWTFAPYRTSTP